MTVQEYPSLVGRVAQCGCGRTEPSNRDLAFFEFKGEGSDAALTHCKNCQYSQPAHTPEAMARNTRLKCTNFEPLGAYEMDRFYCGCRGWE